MKQNPKWYEQVIAMHIAVTDQVSHVKRLRSSRYFVWQEETGQDFLADNHHAETGIYGSTDLFTTQEFDPWKLAFEQSMEAAGAAWKLNSVDYEETTNIYHYYWQWRLPPYG